MTITVWIEAGVCGFRTQAKALSEDDQHVSFQIESGCDKIRSFVCTLPEALSSPPGGPAFTGG